MLINMKIRNKLGLGFGIVTVLFTIAVVMTAFSIGVAKKNSGQVQEESLPFALLALLLLATEVVTSNTVFRRIT